MCSQGLFGCQFFLFIITTAAPRRPCHENNVRPVSTRQNNLQRIFCAAQQQDNKHDIYYFLDQTQFNTTANQIKLHF